MLYSLRLANVKHTCHIDTGDVNCYVLYSLFGNDPSVCPYDICSGSTFPVCTLRLGQMSINFVFFSVHEDFGDNFSDYYNQGYGSKVFHWSLHLSWFWEWQNTPVLSFLSSLLISNIPFNTLLISQWMGLFQGALDQFYVAVVFSWCFFVGHFLHCFCHFFAYYHLTQSNGWCYQFFYWVYVAFFKVIFETFLYCLLNFLKQSCHYEEHNRAHAPCHAPQFPCSAQFAALLSVIKLLILFAH